MTLERWVYLVSAIVVILSFLVGSFGLARRGELPWNRHPALLEPQ